MITETDRALLDLPGVTTYVDNYGRMSLRLDDRKLYGRTNEAGRGLMRRTMDAARASEDPFRQAAARSGDEFGRVAYGYAGGWYDALKGTRGSDWAQRCLDGMWYFAEEAAFVEYAFRVELTGARQGYGGAWQAYLEAAELL